VTRRRRIVDEVPMGRNGKSRIKSRTTTTATTRTATAKMKKRKYRSVKRWSLLASFIIYLLSPSCSAFVSRAKFASRRLTFFFICATRHDHQARFSQGGALCCRVLHFLLLIGSSSLPGSFVSLDPRGIADFLGDDKINDILLAEKALNR